MPTRFPSVDRSATACALWRVEGDRISPAADHLAAEEPLEIQVNHQHGGHRVTQTVSITMRTPGNDQELAAGFLCTEGLLTDSKQIEDIVLGSGPTGATACLRLHDGVEINLRSLQRHGTLTSACGACGKTSLESLRAPTRFAINPDTPVLDAAMIHRLPAAMRHAQAVFAQTGGLHAAALCDRRGNVVAIYEDVGRHNAVDKIIGSQFLAATLPLESSLLVVSGRASFELVQKAIMAGLPVLAAVGAPSSFAVTLAREAGLTLLGFVRDQRFNVYAGMARMPQLLATPRP